MRYKRKNKILRKKKKKIQKRLDVSCTAYKIYKIIEMQQGRKDIIPVLQILVVPFTPA